MNTVTCPCQNCNQSIEFDASEMEQNQPKAALCPHCNLETLLFVPHESEKPASRQFKLSERIMALIAGIIALFLIVLGLVLTDPNTRGQIVIGVMILGIFVLIGIYLKSKGLKAASFLLFIAGILSIIGASYELLKARTTEIPIFEQIDAILLFLGGIVIIALSLILTAIISIRDKVFKTLDNPK